MNAPFAEFKHSQPLTLGVDWSYNCFHSATLI